MTLYLASQSPRRRELLSGLGVEFSVLPIDIDERMESLESAADYVSRLAREKAAAGLAIVADRGESNALFLGSDTAVVVDRDILGKPRDRDDFLDMMERLSGR
ncbi:MAG: Maf family protein, partial [Saccharospirillum sp.]